MSYLRDMITADTELNISSAPIATLPTFYRCSCYKGIQVRIFGAVSALMGPSFAHGTDPVIAFRTDGGITTDFS